MSMPSYPPNGAELTKDGALTMIVASIAMEELALSHILNAEGEKLQYILGTLPGGHGSRPPCAGPQDILAVNKSVAGLLDAVAQNQMLLKGKLEKALEAFGCDRGPDEPGRCGPPQGDDCRPKSRAQLVSQCGGFSWSDGCLFPWQLRARRGSRIRWSKDAPALVSLDPEGIYRLDYTVNVRGSAHGGGSGSIAVKRAPRDAFFDAPPLHFSGRRLDGEAATLQYSAVLFPKSHEAAWAEISLLLNRREGLCVDWAVLNVVEI